MMKQRNKYSTTEIIAVVFCTIGCLLFVAHRFSDQDLFSFGLAFNGIGIIAFLLGQNQKKSLK